MKIYVSLCMLLFACSFAAIAQQPDQKVNSPKVYYCVSDPSDVKTDSFPTPKGAVDHYIQKHMPAGFKLKEGSIEVLENGWVVFTTHKNGQQEASQGGHVTGAVLCPPNSWLGPETGGSFASRPCYCNQGYVAYGDSCKKPEDIPQEEEQAEESNDECAKKNAALSPAQQKLKEKVTKRLKEITDEQNKILANDLEKAKTVLTGPELEMYGKKFFAGYGQAIERLVRDAAKIDKDLKDVVEHIPNSKQKNAPDFRGKGKLPSSVEFDITTQKEMEKKLNTKEEKKCYEFILYDRLNDRQGNLLE